MPAEQGRRASCRRADDAAHESYLLHGITQIHQPRAGHGEDADGGGVIEHQEADLRKIPAHGEETVEVRRTDAPLLLALAYLQAPVAVERPQGQPHEDCQKGQHHVPAAVLQEHQQQSAAHQRGAEAAQRLHAVYQALLLVPEREHGQRIGGDVLRGRGDEREQDEEDDEPEVGLQIEVADEEDEQRIDALAHEDALAETPQRAASPVHPRRPKELQNPRQLDELHQRDGRQAVKGLPHADLQRRGEERHGQRLGYVEAEEGEEVVAPFACQGNELSESVHHTPYLSAMSHACLMRSPMPMPSRRLPAMTRPG